MAKSTKKEEKQAKADKKAEESSRVESFEGLADAVCHKFGKGAMMRLGDPANVHDVEVFKTGSPKLDAALGVGGYPRGRIIEAFGEESSGKTTITLHAIAEAQRSGGRAVFIDAENALDEAYAKKLGVNTADLLVSQPDYGEQALELVDFVLSTGKADIIVIDSVAALVPLAELNGEVGDAHMGLQARMMSQALRKISSKVSKTKAVVIFINQTRDKIGVVWGNPKTTTGGNALKFYASVRLEISRTGSIKKGEEVVGNTVKIKVVKNKMAPPFKVVETEIIFGHGFNVEGEMLDRATILGIVEKSGSWFSYNGDRLGQGRYAVIELLRTNKDLYDRILADIAVEEAADEEN